MKNEKYDGYERRRQQKKVKHEEVNKCILTPSPPIVN